MTAARQPRNVHLAAAQPSATHRVMGRLAERRGSGVNVVLLSADEPDFNMSEHVRNACEHASSATRPGGHRLRYWIRSSRPNQRFTISPVSQSTQCICNTRFATSNPYVVACVSGPPFYEGWFSSRHSGTRAPPHTHTLPMARIRKRGGVHSISALLEAEVLVTSEPNKGAFVSSRSLAEVIEIFDIRIGLELRA